MIGELLLQTTVVTKKNFFQAIGFSMSLRRISMYFAMQRLHGFFRLSGTKVIELCSPTRVPNFSMGISSSKVSELKPLTKFRQLPCKKGAGIDSSSTSAASSRKVLLPPPPLIPKLCNEALGVVLCATADKRCTGVEEVSEDAAKYHLNQPRTYYDVFDFDFVSSQKFAKGSQLRSPPHHPFPNDYCYYNNC